MTDNEIYSTNQLIKYPSEVNRRLIAQTHVRNFQIVLWICIIIEIELSLLSPNEKKNENRVIKSNLHIESINKFQLLLKLMNELKMKQEFMESLLLLVAKELKKEFVHSSISA